MNPFALVALALVGLLAVSIYLGASSKSSQTMEIKSQKHELEVMKFDRDFSNFLEGEKVSKPTVEEIQKQQKTVAVLEEKKRLSEVEEEKRRAEMQKSIDELSGYKGNENES